MFKKIHARFSFENPVFQGISWSLIACFWFAVMTVIIRHLSSSIEPALLVFFRNVFAFAFMIPWGLRMGKNGLRTKRLDLNLWRAFTGALGMYAWFYSIAIIPLPEAVSLSFTVPLVSSLLGILLLGERVGTQRWVALGIGFLGTLVILRPGADAFKMEFLFVLSATVAWSMSNILVKKLTKTDSPRVIVFYMSFLMTPLTMPLALYYWKTPSAEELLWLVALGWVSNIAQISISHAFAKADVSVILPFDFFRLLFVSVFAYFIYDERLTLWSAVGALIILSSAFLMVHHEVRLSRLTKRLAKKLIS